MEREVAELLALPSDQFWRKVDTASPASDEASRPESLVCVIREMIGRGEERDAWRIAEILVRRIAGTVARFLARLYGLSRDEREEIADDLSCQLYGEWLSMEPGHEFWEIRFNLCLKRRMMDAADRRKRTTTREVVLVSRGEDQDTETDLMEQMPDQAAMSPETAAIVMSALGSLAEPLRSAFYLYYHEEWSEEDIAQRLGKTSRTVRNYLRRAEQQLASWRGTEMQE